MINTKRIYIRNTHAYSSGPIVYWMSRDQRVQDNWALLYGQQKALEYQVPLIVVFNLLPEFLEAMKRQYAFMLAGLREVEIALKHLNIGFQVVSGAPRDTIPRFLNQTKAGMLIADFDPLRIKQQWQAEVGQRIQIPFVEVDAHNVVPCRVASVKQEYAAYTIRPKIHRKLFEFLEPSPDMLRHPFMDETNPAVPTDWAALEQQLHLADSNGTTNSFDSGETAAANMLAHFIQKKLNRYDADRNDPTLDGVSNLSPYLHFGQISAQKIAYEVSNLDAEVTAKDAFLEELIVRRELADNFCFYNPNYDSWLGFSNWAQLTLIEHRADPRQYIYSFEQFENAETHDPLWNACQIEMVQNGKMHGYLRMYWAKKILEWTPTVQEALQIAITLNDRYELDGRDPNGYTGVAWAIGGVHDRAWFQRSIFGKIRYMNERGCRRKFDVDHYIQQVSQL